MLNLRTVILSALLVVVLAGAIHFAVAAAPATSSAATGTCPVAVSSAYFSEQALRNILNGRYERRVGLPR